MRQYYLPKREEASPTFVSRLILKSNTRSIPIIGLITAESLSLMGNQIAVVAIPILVLQFTNFPSVTGIASAANIVPIILAAILGGRAIDRFGAWKMSVSADLLSFFLFSPCRWHSSILMKLLHS